MRDFLLDGLPLKLYYSFYNDYGRDNIDKLLGSLEVINHVLEDPVNSTWWLDVVNARYDGVNSSVFKFPSLIDKYFPMSFTDFLTYRCSNRIFRDFEDECLQSCASLDVGQVCHAFKEALFVFELTKDGSAS